MNAGRLDRRLQFQRATLSDDGFGSVEVFASHGSPVWASKKDVSDAERWRAGEVSAIISARFVLRSSAFSRGLTPNDRLVCDGVTYEISGIKEIARRQWIEITASARADR
ncbi:MAG: head-tail adaptor protein [Rhodobacteraceae bacterium]|nr:head-tail adaptor protein [Paracoccaceae bacterium]